MKFFIDTANLDEIREANDLGVLDGVTTNPSLMAKEGITGEENILNHYKQICKIVQGVSPVNAHAGLDEKRSDFLYLPFTTDKRRRRDGQVDLLLGARRWEYAFADLEQALAGQVSKLEQDLIAALATRYAEQQPEDRRPLDEAYAAARSTTLSILGSLRRELGDLDRITGFCGSARPFPVERPLRRVRIQRALWRMPVPGRTC
mgnify:CR=1 FL=1